MAQKIFNRNVCKCIFTNFSRAKGDNFITMNTNVLRAFSHVTNCRAISGLTLHGARLKQHCCNTSQKSMLEKNFSSASNNSLRNERVTYIDTKDPSVLDVLSKDMQVIEDFITEEEEQNILTEIEPYLKRLKYQSSHWDDAIHEYRETERGKWSEKNMAIIQRIRDTAFPPGVPQLSYVHVLDLKKEGQIKPHVDAVRFCGNTIAGISLVSSSVMRLVNTEDKTKLADILLKQRSLYIMKDEARYKYTHEILHEKESYFCGNAIPRDRRISVICRNEPET